MSPTAFSDSPSIARLARSAAMAMLVVGTVAACTWSGSTGPTAPQTTAQYRVTFDATWSSTSHPTDFPSSAHFSRLVDATHRVDTAL